MSAAPDDVAAHFVAKWHRREPEMAVAEAFCPPAMRPRFRAWGALVQALRETAFELSDTQVTLAKCQWWAGELLAMESGAGRHPLAAPLSVPGLAWQPLARALLDQAQFDARPGGVSQALASMAPFAAALADVEAGLFQTTAAPADSVAVHLLLQRLPEGLVATDQARLPLNLLARHGLSAAQVAAGQGDALLRDWARALLDAAPPPRQACLFRRQRSAFDRVRLARLAAGKGFAAPAGLGTLWRAWRQARAA